MKSSLDPAEGDCGIVSEARGETSRVEERCRWDWRSGTC